MNKRPDMKTSFEYKGMHILVEWFDVAEKKLIPDLKWKQVYAIGDLAGMVPLVTSSERAEVLNLPGGTVEPGESIEQTLRRELIEECNMRVLSWEPLGYQIVTAPNGQKSAEMRVFAVLEKIGDFVQDPGGNVIANTLVSFDEIENSIRYGDTGKRLMQLARKYFT